MAEPQKLANIEKNWELYKKAYLIEFVGEGGTPEDIFTFSVPPESEELSYAQRKTETKTFGGLHVDEYGIDAVKITLSGSTINQELKRIYKAGVRGEDEWLSGEDEIYRLRDLIEEYKTTEKIKTTKIYLYDLSKYTNNSGIKNYWRVFQGDFKIRRSSDRPYTYKYSIEFTGVTPDKESNNFNIKAKPPGTDGVSKNKIDDLTGKMTGDPNVHFIEEDFSSLSNVITDANLPTPEDTQKLKQWKLTDRIYKGLTGAIDFIDGINAKVNNVLGEIKKVSDLIKILGNVMTYSTSTLTGIIDSAGDTVVGFIDGAASVANGVNSVVSLPKTIQLKALNVGLDIQNATKRLVNAVDDLSSTCRSSFAGEYYEIPQEVLDQFEMNNEEFKDSVCLMLTQAESIAYEMAAAAKSANIPDVSITNPDPETGEQRIVLSYGYTDVTLKSTDTLESLAAEYFGDPDRAIDIATFNGVASLDDLMPGDTIQIPIIQQTSQNKKNLIFSTREERDNYGKDIMLTDDGGIVVSPTGDYALTSGPNNLAQAILLRIRESVAKRVRLTAYGIRTNISDPTAGVAYIVSSIDLTVKSDPRVLSVRDIRFRAKGDALWVDVIYNDINKADGNVAGGA